MGDLDDLVINEIKKLATDPEYFHIIRKEKEEASDSPNKIDILKTEIKKLDEQISRFMDLYGIGTFTIDQVSEKINPLNDQKKGLEKELEALNADLNVMTEEEVQEIVSTFAEVMDRGELNEIRLAIESLISFIEIDNDDVYIHWKFA